MWHRANTLLRDQIVKIVEWVLDRPVSVKRPEDPVASGRITLGRHSYGCPVVWAFPGDTAKVIVGSFCAFAEESEVFVGGNHRFDWVSMFHFQIVWNLPHDLAEVGPATKGDVVIGNEVWIGKRAAILSGVHVGNGAVIGAYSVVTRDVRPYAVVAGNPAREVKRRFTDDQIEALQTIAWWEWSDERLREEIPMLNSTGVDAFIAKWGR